MRTGRRAGRGSGLTWLLAASSLAACDADPTLAGGWLNETSNTALVHDNPVIVGTALTLSESWVYHDAVALDPARPASSKQSVSAHSEGNQEQTVTEITASHSVFAGSMSAVASPFVLPPGGTSEVFMTSFKTSTVPWLYLPSNCTRFDNPNCQGYWSRPAPNAHKPYTFPYVVGDISLPPNTTVTLNAVKRFANRSARPNWQTATTVMQSLQVRLDPELIVVPVHVHVFTRSDGALNNTFMGGFANSSAGRAAFAKNLRRVFDDYAVEVGGTATIVSDHSWERGYTTQMTRNIMDGNPGNANDSLFDALLEDCKVQVRLASVDFIRQSNGLERATITYGSSFSELPFAPQGDATAASSALMSQYILSVNRNAGAHVFVVGTVNPGQFSSFETAGIAFDQNGTAPGYALLSGLSGSNGSFAGAKGMLQHEVAHVLGLLHANASFTGVDEINAMFSHTLTAQMCSKMRSSSQRLTVAASTSPR